MTWLVVIIILIGSVFFLMQRMQKIKNESLKHSLLDDAKSYMRQVLDAKSFTPISTSIILKKNEIAFLECTSFLYESRSVRYFQSSGAGARVARRIYLSSRGGSSYSQDELKNIDHGNLTLTNSRLVFTGNMNSRNINLSKIVAVNLLIDAIKLSIDGHQKCVVLTVPNPLIWATTIKILATVDDPLNLSITQEDYTLCFEE